MEDLASMRYKIINTMVSTYIEQERKFFGTCFTLINNFYNDMYKLQQDLPYTPSNYDPMKYTRATKIMEGVDANSLPNIKMKDKYSLNNSKNNFQRANSCVNNYSNNMNNIGKNNPPFNKKFSYEDYKMRKSSIDNSKNSQTNNITTFSNNFINNNENDKNTNPYSYEAYKKRTQSLGNNKRPQFRSHKQQTL